MATNLEIDIELLNEAQSISGLKTKRETVNSALKEFVDRRKQLELIGIFGEYNPDTDYIIKRLGSGESYCRYSDLVICIKIKAEKI